MEVINGKTGVWPIYVNDTFIHFFSNPPKQLITDFWLNRYYFCPLSLLFFDLLNLIQ